VRKIKILSVMILAGMTVGVTAASREPAPTPSTGNASGTEQFDPTGELRQKFDAVTQWYCYKKAKGVNRLKVFGQGTYYGPQDGEPFKRVNFNGKNYVRNAKGMICEESWENAAGFADRFVEREKMVAEVQSKLDEANAKVKELQQKIDENKRRLDECRMILSRINIKITDLNSDRQQGYNQDSIRNQINQLERARRDQNQIMHGLQKEERDLRNEAKKIMPQQQELDKLRKRLDQIPAADMNAAKPPAAKPAVKAAAAE